MKPTTSAILLIAVALIIFALCWIFQPEKPVDHVYEPQTVDSVYSPVDTDGYYGDTSTVTGR